MRSGYTDDAENLELYRANVDRAIRGKRGQALLRDCLSALDAMPEKVLIPEEIVDAGGSVCLLGAGGRKRGVPDLDKLNPEDHATIGARLNVANCLVAECEYVNDEAGPYGKNETPEERFVRVRKWLVKNIAEAK